MNSNEAPQPPEPKPENPWPDIAPAFTVVRKIIVAYEKGKDWWVKSKILVLG